MDSVNLILRSDKYAFNPEDIETVYFVGLIDAEFELFRTNSKENEEHQGNNK